MGFLSLFVLEKKFGKKDYDSSIIVNTLVNESSSIHIPFWEATMIEATWLDVGDAIIGWQTHNKEQHGSASLKAQVLGTYDLNTYVDVQGILEWETIMTIDIDPLKKNHTWELVPWQKGKNVVKCQWFYKTKFTYNGDVEFSGACLVTKRFSQ